LSSILQWNFENTDYGPFDAAETSTGFNYTGASWDYPKPLIEFLCYEPGIEAVVPDIEPTVFLPSGQTVFRNDWSFASPGHRYLLFQGVAEAPNHEHYEHLSFILQAENQMLSSDSGYSRKSYGEAIRTEWYRTPEAHNVAMVNGEAPADPVPSQGPESQYRLVSPFFSSELKTAPYAAGGTHQRLIAFLDQERFAIVDQVEVPEESEIAIVLHGGRAQLEQEGDQSLWTYGQDIYGPPAVLGQWFFGEDFSFERKVGELTYIKGDYEAFPYTVHSLQGTSAFSLGLLDPASNREGLSAFSSDSKDPRHIVVRGADLEMIADATSSGWVQGEIESDGMFVVTWSHESGPCRAAMVGGTRLRLGDGLAVTLSAPSAIALEIGSDLQATTVYLSEGSGIKATVSMGEMTWEGVLQPGRQILSEDDL